jgi:hypothetical protein
MRSSVALVAVAFAFLSACSSTGGGPRTPLERIDRALAETANPGEVVAAEIAFMQAVEREGYERAVRDFAVSSTAVLRRETPSGMEAARGGERVAAQRQPRDVWMSCDGSLAVSAGRTSQNGFVGDFATVWQRERRGEYLWSYSLELLDDPQPVPEPATEPDEDVIVVTDFPSINGEVADCLAEGAAPADVLGAGAPAAATLSGRSRDGTLRWYQIDGARDAPTFAAFIWRDGRWEEALRLGSMRD